MKLTVESTGLNTCNAMLMRLLDTAVLIWQISSTMIMANCIHGILKVSFHMNVNVQGIVTC